MRHVSFIPKLSQLFKKSETNETSPETLDFTGFFVSHFYFVSLLCLTFQIKNETNFCIIMQENHNIYEYLYK